ncbi:MAG: NAD-dependent epimerase/dehydratase family protein [Clostridiales bacterium]|nr:NAD-dependent epimerase/dehydratase family protein [Clostridiales bacterium]
MKILVTGGTVFVSKYIAQYFADSGHEVYVLNRNTKPQLKNVTPIICDRANIDGRLKAMYFNAAIDVTAYTADDIDNLLDNLCGFDNYVMISSSAVYPETLDLPFKENDSVGKNKFWGDYGTNKIAAENALLKRVKKAYIIRPPYLYGEYNNIYREAFVFDCAEKDVPFYMPKDGSMPLQFFHVADLCKFIDILLEVQPKDNIFNVGNAPITVREWIELCYSAVRKTPAFINVSPEIEQRNYFPFFDYGYVLDTTRQNKIMPIRLPMNIGLSRAYDWYKNNKDQVRTKGYLEFIKNKLR